MYLRISKTLLATGLLTMALFSCSKDDAGQVLSITERFESQEVEKPTYADPSPAPEEMDLVLKNGEFSTFVNNEDKTAKFFKLFLEGENYIWSFPGASPQSSTEADPGVITFPGAGDYTVSLEVTVDDETYMHSETITFE